MKKNDENSIRWFLSELSELKEKSLLTEENASVLESYYCSKLESVAENGKKRLQIFLIIICAGLIGCGAIMIIAHNWYNLSSEIRLLMGFIPLTLGMFAGAYTILRKCGAQWKELSALLIIAGIMSSIADVSQVYHIDGGIHDYIRICMFLAIPIIYIFSSGASLLIYIIGCTFFIFEKPFFGGYSMFPVFFFAVLPLIMYQIKRFPESSKSVFFSYLFCVLNVLYIINMYIDFSWGESYTEATMKTIILLSSILFAAYEMHSAERPANVLKKLGYGGLALIALIYSCPLGLRTDLPVLNWEGITYALIFSRAFSGVLLIIMAGFAVARRNVCYYVPFLMLVLLCGNYFFGFTLIPYLMSALIVCVAVYLFWKGERTRLLASMNYGLLLLFILTAEWFLSSDIPILMRGIGFISAGIIAGGINFFYSRSFKRNKIEKEVIA